TRIVEFARVFRDRERGDRHLPEFTMLEWYRAGAPCAAVIDDCLAVIGRAAETAGARRLTFRGIEADPLAAERLTVADAFARFAGIDLLATVRGGEGDRAALAAAAAERVRIAADDTWSDIFGKVLVAAIEPQLGR